MERLVQGGEASVARWVVGATIEMVLGTDEPQRDWPEAVAVYFNGQRLGWINGGGEPMRASLREVAARGLCLVVPGVVESVQGGVAVRLSAPWPADVAVWLAQGAEVVDGAALRPVEVLSTRGDGSVLRGRRLPLAEALYAAGTPPVWGLAKRPEPSERVATVRIGDVLTVAEDEHGWSVSDAAGPLGRLTWRRGDNGKPHAMTGVEIRYPALGRLLVSQVVEADGRVVNFGGIVTADTIDLRDAVRRTLASSPPPPESTAAREPGPVEPSPVLGPAHSAAALARELHAEYPEGVPTDVLFDRAEAARLDIQAVDRALDSVLDAARVKVRRVKVNGLRVLDLAPLDSVRTRIKGSAYWVTDSERKKHGGPEYLLIREPENEVDTSAVAVYGNGRKVGHISAAGAARLAPLLDQLDADAFRVTGTGTSQNSVVLWVDVPKVDALRRLVRAQD